ncbi:MAG: hypothetical protein ACTSRH_12900 [Promethearchaeota archaeon]
MYCVFRLITGFSVDISFKVLKEKKNINEKVKDGITGVIMSLIYFGKTLIAMGFFYKGGWMAGSSSDHGTFLGVSYIGLPWTIINAYFGGFTAHTIAHAIDFFSKNK